MTIDSIWFAGSGNTQIYMDNVMHNPNGLITPGYIPGDFDGDGLVNSADYTAWRSSFVRSVTPWTGADGNGDGTVDVADYVMWRRQMTLASEAQSASATAVPEPAGLVMFALAAGFVILVRQRLIG